MNGLTFLRDLKRLVAMIIAGAVGLIVLIDFAGVTTLTQLNLMARLFVDWAAFLVVMALLVGLLSVTGSHIMRVVRRRPDWIYSLVLLAGMLLMIASGTIVPVRNTVSGNLELPNSLIEQSIRELFRAFYQPLAGSFLALLAFFSLSAALRALRHRTADTLVIMVVAIVVLSVTALPQAQMIPLLGESVRWASDYLALAGARGLLIGSALGALVAGVRVLLGFDQPYLDR